MHRKSCPGDHSSFNVPENANSSNLLRFAHPFPRHILLFPAAGTTGSANLMEILIQFALRLAPTTDPKSFHTNFSCSLRIKQKFEFYLKFTSHIVDVDFWNARFSHNITRSPSSPSADAKRIFHILLFPLHFI